MLRRRIFRLVDNCFISVFDLAVISFVVRFRCRNIVVFRTRNKCMGSKKRWSSMKVVCFD